MKVTATLVVRPLKWFVRLRFLLRTRTGGWADLVVVGKGGRPGTSMILRPPRAGGVALTAFVLSRARLLRWKNVALARSWHGRVTAHREGSGRRGVDGCVVSATPRCLVGGVAVRPSVRPSLPFVSLVALAHHSAGGSGTSGIFTALTFKSAYSTCERRELFFCLDLMGFKTDLNLFKRWLKGRWQPKFKV